MGKKWFANLEMEKRKKKHCVAKMNVYKYWWLENGERRTKGMKRVLYGKTLRNGNYYYFYDGVESFYHFLGISLAVKI
jgi:hypothetical protein